MGDRGESHGFQDDADTATVYLHLSDGTRVLIGLRDHVTVLTREVDELLGDPEGVAMGRALSTFLYDGWRSDEPLGRETANAIGREAADLMPLTYGHLSQRSKMVLERMVGLRSL
jgi:hypothetical protein